MRTLKLTAERHDFLRALSIGATLNVKWHPARGGTDGPELEFTAEVIEQRPDDERPEEGEADILVATTSEPGGKVVTLMHSDAESLITKIEGLAGEGWFELSEEQPLHYDEETQVGPATDDDGFMAGVEAAEAETIEATAEDKPQLPAATQAGTAVAAYSVPPRVQWLITEAAILDAEAARYSKFGTIHHHLRHAASQLRSAVGFALDGTDAPEF